MSKIVITGLNKADVLAALYNASKPQMLGFLQSSKNPMTTDEAQILLDSGQTYFDYLHGRVMKIDLSSDEFFESWGYDRDNGEGAAQLAVDQLFLNKGNNSDEIQNAHKEGTKERALQASKELYRGSKIDPEDGSITLGLDKDLSDALVPKLEETLKALDDEEKNEE